MNDLIEVLLLAGRLGLDDDGWPLSVLLDCLKQRGVLARVICLSRGSSAVSDSRILEFPTLGNRWLKTLTIRRLPVEAAIEHPCVLHVLHETMAAAASRWPSLGGFLISRLSMISESWNGG